MNLIKKLFKTNKLQHIIAIGDGKIIRIENIPDYGFSNKMIGDGLAMEISSKSIYSPCKGTISVIAITKHAFIITLEDNAEILVHIGLNKQKPNSNNYNFHVNVGDKVDTNTLIVTIDEAFLNSNQSKIIVPITLLNYDTHPIRTLTTSSYVEKGQTLFTYKK